MKQKELSPDKLDISITELPQRRVRLDITVPFSEVADDLSKIKKEAVKDLHVRGFRKHKTPFEVAKPFVSKKKIDSRFLETVTARLVNAALKQTNIQPATFPRCEVSSFKEGEPLVLTLYVPLEPEVNLGKYKEIKAWRPKLEVREVDVEERLDYLRRAYGKLEAKNGPIAEGDMVRYDTVMVVDGHEISRTAAKDLWLEVEIDGPSGVPSAALIGASINDSRLLDTYDEHGAPITLKHNIKEIMEPVLPASDKDLLTRAADKYPGCKTISDLKKLLFEEVSAEKHEVAQTFFVEEIIRKIVSQSKVEVPPELTEIIIEGRIDEITRGLEEKGLTLKAHLQENDLDEETFRHNLIKETEFTMKTNTVLEAIARKEKLAPSLEELCAAARAEGVAPPPGDARDEFSFLEAVSPESAVKLRRALIQEKALNFLVENVKPLNFEDRKRTVTRRTRSSAQRRKA